MATVVVGMPIFCQTFCTMKRFFGLVVAMMHAVVVMASASVQLQQSDHFDGKRFHNIEKTPGKSLWQVLKWRFSRTAPVENGLDTKVTPSKPPTKIANDDVRITFVGHSTFLLQANNMNVLTDPIWSKRCSPVSFLGPERLKEPGIRFEDLPKIDVVVVSHNHYDHMDMPTLLRLWQRDRPVFIVPLKNRDTLAEAGIGHVVEQRG